MASKQAAAAKRTDPSAPVKALSKAPQSTRTIPMVALAVAVLLAASWRIFASPSYEPLVFHKALRVRNSSGKGKGVFATKDIIPGELLIREDPVVVVPTEASGAQVLSMLSNASTADRYAFWDLSTAAMKIRANDPKPLEARALAILKTNAVGGGPGTAGWNKQLGVFPAMARLNHGCAGASNAVYSLRESGMAGAGERGEVRVYAVKDIKKGEEILITYIDGKLTKADRTHHLHDKYGFDCTCAACMSSGAQATLSDKKLGVMGTVLRMVGSWSGGGMTGREAVRNLQQALDISAQTGYLNERGRLAADAAHVAAAHSDEEATRAWSALAHQYYAIELGADNWYSGPLAAVAEDPTKHQQWGQKKAATVPGPLDPEREDPLEYLG